MKQNTKTSDNIKTKSSPLSQKIPITYLWFGKSVPEDYLISMANLDFPVIFLKNPKLDRNFTRQLMEVQKSDYYRLQYLYNQGGIYSDFDNIIDYPCLMKILQPYRTQGKLVFQSVGKHTRQKMKEMTNGMIFAPQKNMLILQKMLDGVDERKKKIWDFAGLSYLGKFSEPVEYDMSKCVIHTGDWSWFKDSNAVLKKSTGPHERFKKKLIKKKDFLMQQQDLIDNLKEIKQDYNVVQANFIGIIKSNEEQIKLMKQFDKNPYNSGQSEAFQNKKSQNTGVFNEKASKTQLIDIHKDFSQNDLQTIAQSREKQTMQSYLSSLFEKNSQLKHEQDMVMTSIGGLSIFIVVFAVIGYLVIKKRYSSF